MNIYDILLYTLPLVIFGCLFAFCLRRKQYNRKIGAVFAIFAILLILYYIYIYIILTSKYVKDILANTAPLVIIAYICILYLNMAHLDNDIINIILIISLVLYYIYISSVFASGYGNKFLVIIMQIIFLLFYIICVILSFLFWKDVGFEGFEEIIISFIFFIGLIYTMFCIYIRLKFENILDIKWINTIINNFKNIKLLDDMPKIQNSIFKILEKISKLPENEWFKGIVITIIGGTASTIIATLILDKRKKK